MGTPSLSLRTRSSYAFCRRRSLDPKLCPSGCCANRRILLGDAMPPCHGLKAAADRVPLRLPGPGRRERRGNVWSATLSAVRERFVAQPPDEALRIR